MVASVPELQKVTLSTPGTMSQNSFANAYSYSWHCPYEVPRGKASLSAASTSSGAFPRIMVEKPSMQSRYSLSSASHILAPFARLTTMGKGSARRNRLPTPAGMTVRFSRQIDNDFGLFTIISSRYVFRIRAILSRSSIAYPPDSDRSSFTGYPLSTVTKLLSDGASNISVGKYLNIQRNLCDCT